ncbi:ARP2/3 complex 34 kDa subunit [Pelomyxa schiedti]|nr:ARP2/3 complex 34 kDa subunit [Pelomyxa schiedti]
MPHPLYLESINRIIRETLILKFKEKTPENVDITVADFNQCLWNIFGTQENRTLLVSASCRCWAQLQKWGAMDYLRAQYGAMIVETRPKYDITLSVEPPADPAADCTALATKVASLLRNMMAGAFHAVFDAVGKVGPVRDIPYRPMEGLWLKPEGDRVIAIFSIAFDDPDDQVIGRVFLQEFSKNVSGAPSCSISVKDPPLELQGIRGIKADGYASFLLEARHMAPRVREQTINMLLQYRNYVHYHIKCSKAYLHIRMRTRAELLLKVLNRAKGEKPDAPKKTASGRTFTRS